MKQFEEQLTVPSTYLYRAASVSSTRGDRIVEKLTSDGLINPQKTPAGHTIFTPPDGEIVFDALVNGDQ